MLGYYGVYRGDLAHRLDHAGGLDAWARPRWLGWLPHEIAALNAVDRGARPPRRDARRTSTVLGSGRRSEANA